MFKLLTFPLLHLNFCVMLKATHRLIDVDAISMIFYLENFGHLKWIFEFWGPKIYGNGLRTLFSSSSPLSII